MCGRQANGTWGKGRGGRRTRQRTGGGMRNGTERGACPSRRPRPATGAARGDRWVSRTEGGGQVRAPGGGRHGKSAGGEGTRKKKEKRGAGQCAAATPAGAATKKRGGGPCQMRRRRGGARAGGGGRVHARQTRTGRRLAGPPACGRVLRARAQRSGGCGATFLRPETPTQLTQGECVTGRHTHKQHHTRAQRAQAQGRSR